MPQGDMDHVTGVHGVDHLERATIDDRHLTGVAQRDREEILQIAPRVLRRRGPLPREHRINFQVSLICASDISGGVGGSF